MKPEPSTHYLRTAALLGSLRFLGVVDVLRLVVASFCVIVVDKGLAQSWGREKKEPKRVSPGQPTKRNEGRRRQTLGREARRANVMAIQRSDGNKKGWQRH